MDGTVEGTHERRDPVDNARRCECHEENEKGRGTCYVLMNSREYGTHVWPCEGLDEAIETLARLARSAEERRHVDGIQRYFCIRGTLPKEMETAACDPVSPPHSDTDALTLTIHFRDTRGWREQEARHCRCRRADETRKEVAA